MIFARGSLIVRSPQSFQMKLSLWNLTKSQPRTGLSTWAFMAVYLYDFLPILITISFLPKHLILVPLTALRTTSRSSTSPSSGGTAVTWDPLSIKSHCLRTLSSTCGRRPEPLGPSARLGTPATTPEENPTHWTVRKMDQFLLPMFLFSDSKFSFQVVSRLLRQLDEPQEILLHGAGNC